MDFGTLGYTKASYAATMARPSPTSCTCRGCGGVVLRRAGREFLPARHRPGQLRHLMLALEKPAGGTATDLAAPLKRLVEIVRKRGVLVLISDFLAPIDRLENSLAQLTASGHEVLAFRVLDPSNFGLSSPSRRCLRMSNRSGRSSLIRVPPVPSTGGGFKPMETIEGALPEAGCGISSGADG